MLDLTSEASMTSTSWDQLSACPPASPRRTVLRRGGCRASRPILATSGWERSGSPRTPDAGREQPRGLLVLVEAQMARSATPTSIWAITRSWLRLGRRLPGRHAVGAGLCEIVGQVAEQVVDLRPEERLLRGVAQEGGREAELAAGLLGVTAQAGELRLGERHVDQRVGPGDTLGAPLGLGDGGRAGVAIAVQPVQQRLLGPHLDDVLDGADLGERPRSPRRSARRLRRAHPHGELARQLGQGQRDPEPLAERPELRERAAPAGPPPPAPPWPRTIRILPNCQPSQRAYPGVVALQQRLERRSRPPPVPAAGVPAGSRAPAAGCRAGLC